MNSRILFVWMMLISMSTHAQTGEYDLAGFAVGAVKKDQLIDGKTIKAGDVVLALKSSGVHSNGFSLVRKVIEKANVSLHDKAPWSEKSFGEVSGSVRTWDKREA